MAVISSPCMQNTIETSANITVTSIETATDTDELANETPFTVSKAALRRLAHDAGTRMLKSHYETGMTALIQFLQDVMKHAYNALTYSKRKSINTDHVYYALKVAQVPLPSELSNLPNDELKTLKKCNVHADWLHRKNTVLAAEISEASFKRLLKQIGKQLDLQVHFTIQARHLLQLIAEVYVVRTFAKLGNDGTANSKPQNSSCNSLTSVTTTHHANSAPLVHACQAMLDYDAAISNNASAILSKQQIDKATEVFNTIITNIPALLQLSASRTVDKRLMQTAVHSLNIDLSNVTEIHDARSPTVKIVCKILRGQLVDKRITANAMVFLCDVIHNTIRSVPYEQATMTSRALVESAIDITIEAEQR